MAVRPPPFVAAVVPAAVVRRAEEAARARGIARAAVGVDPGRGGYAAVLALRSDEARLVRLKPYDIDGFPVVDLEALREVLATPAACFVEHVHGRGGGAKGAVPWSASGTFTFGALAGGVVSGLAGLGWPVALVRPAAWQKRLGVVRGTGDPKAAALAAYHRLFPHDPLPRGPLGKLNGNAVDAMLIAAYGVLDLGFELRRWRFPARRPSCRRGAAIRGSRPCSR